MDMSNRIKFLQITKIIDKDGYSTESYEEVYKCWTNINKYFSKLQFDSMNLDITKNLNITVRYCNKIESLLADENIKNISIEFKNKKYSIEAVDFLRYERKFVQMVVKAYE